MTTESRPLLPDDLATHAAWMGRLARRLVRDEAAAEDLVQDAWLQALQRGLRPVGPVRSFLAGVLRNLSNERRRSAAAAERRERRAARDEALPSAAQLAEALDCGRVVLEELRSLEDPLRETLALRYVHDLSAAEIARRQGVPAGTVRWRLSRGLDALRERLDARHGGRRAAWCAALVHLAPRPRVAALRLGVATMAGTIVAATLAVAIGAWVLGEGGAAPGSAVEPEGVAETAAGGGPVLAEGRGAQRAPAAEGSPPADASKEVADEEGSMTLRARILGADGAPVAGAFVKAGASKVMASTEGAVEIVHTWAPNEDDDMRPVPSVGLLFRAPWHVRLVRDVELVDGADVDLGDVRLAPAGSISGRAVDEVGAPVGGVHAIAAARVVEPAANGERWPGRDSVRVRTKEDGSFLLKGVAVGERTLYAEHASWIETEPLELVVAAGEEIVDVQLVVRAKPEPDVLALRFVDGDGAPVPWMRTKALFGGPGAVVGGWTGSADAQGVRRWDARPGLPIRVFAWDRDQAWSGAVWELASMDEGEHELVLAPAVHVPLDELPGVDAVPAAYELDLWASDGTSGRVDFVKGETPQTAPVPGHLWLPPVTFFAELQVDGAPPLRLGPLDPADLGAGPSAPAEPDVRVAGVVRGPDGPVAGARVAAHPMYGASMSGQRYGFPLRVDARALAETTSDAEGRYELRLDAAALNPPDLVLLGGSFDEVALFVEADGLARAERSPIGLAAGVQLDGVDVDVEVGGRLEGRVLLPPGEDPRGTLVAISRGGVEDAATLVDADGRFAFDGLTPGPWMVERRWAKRSNLGFGGLGGPSQPMRFVCEVVSGETTIHDLDHAGNGPYSLLGTLTLGDRDLAGWTAAFAPRQPMPSAPAPPAATLDGGGSFTIEGEIAGAGSLDLRAPDGSLAIHTSARLDLVPATWSGSWATGTLSGSLDEPGELAFAASLPELFGSIVASIVRDADGSFRLEGLPAVEGRIVRVQPGSPRMASTWSAVASVTVPAGGEVVVP